MGGTSVHPDKVEHLVTIGQISKMITVQVNNIKTGISENFIACCISIKQPPIKCTVCK